MRFQYEQLWLFVYCLVLFSLLLDPEIFWLISQRYCLVENTTQKQQREDKSRWMQGGDICGITGAVLSRRELILHQASSIFLGSGSRGKCSPDTRRKVCSVGPRGGLYGKRRLRSLPASHLQAKHQGFTNISQGFLIPKRVKGPLKIPYCAHLQIFTLHHGLQQISMAQWIPKT